jgi:DDE superfamily endonuclease/Tc5 transposase DNA-binding domain
MTKTRQQTQQQTLKKRREDAISSAVQEAKVRRLKNRSQKRASLSSIALKHKISPQTLSNRLNGSVSRAEAREAQQHLSKAEEDILVDWILKLSAQGFGPTIKLLKKLASGIIRRKNSSFKEVGEKWVHRFRQRHSDRLGGGWSNNLDIKRGKAVNKSAVADYYRLLEKVVKEKEITPDRIYGMDEKGFLLGKAPRTYVLGPKGTYTPYVNEDGKRETISVVECICADGTAIPPQIVFKGKRRQESWALGEAAEELRAQYGLSENGYMDSQLGYAWIKRFEEETKEKGLAGTRLLLLDGHESHISFDLVQFAAEHNIDVISYPSHSTHVLQGLDKCMFRPLNRAWGHEVLKNSAFGTAITKTDFTE